jgi:hypothetical protein
MNRLCLATAYTSNFAVLGDMATATLGFYADAHCCAVHVNPSVHDFARPTSWYKLQLIQQLFAEGYDWVLWVDADALFMRFEIDVRGVIEAEKHLYIVSHDIPHQQADQPVPNCGVLLIRNCQWSQDLLSDIWNSTQYIQHAWWENAALLHLLGFYGLLGEGENRPNADMLRHVAFIDTAWNSIPGVCSAPNPIIHHYAGMAHEQRLAGMSRDFMMSLQAAENAGLLSHEWQRALNDHRAWLRTEARIAS